MISCEFHGRLGNNMFQVAATAAIAKKLDVEFSVPSYTLAGHRGQLPVELQGFSYPYNYHQDNVVQHHEKVGEKDSKYTELPVKDEIKLCGFFQSSKYFDDIRDDLINKYFSPASWVLNLSKKYNIGPKSLAICVRRGDYLMLQHNHCVLAEQYYQDVCLDIVNRTNIEQVFVFSDDLDWCADVFSEMSPVLVKEDKFVQLYMMTQMKNVVLANSTFSWWGAYLNNMNGIVYFPDPWYGPNNQHIDVSGLVRPDWRIMKHQIVVQPYLEHEARKG